MRKEIAGIEKEMEKAGFWDDRERAEVSVSKLKDLKGRLEPLGRLENASLRETPSRRMIRARRFAREALATTA